MGLTLEFLAGDSKLLLDAVKEFDFDALYEPPACLYHADFSLHLVPRDLDSLSESFGLVMGIDPIPLRPSLTVAIDTEDGGAMLVEDRWVAYVAKCAPDLAHQVAHRWLEEMRIAHPNEKIELTDEMTKAVTSLITLCAHASTGHRQVIHVWYP